MVQMNSATLIWRPGLKLDGCDRDGRDVCVVVSALAGKVCSSASFVSIAVVVILRLLLSSICGSPPVNPLRQHNDRTLFVLVSLKRWCSVGV